MPELIDIDRRVRIKEVLSLTAMSRTTLWRRIRAQQFPEPKHDGRMAYWHLSTVQGHLDKKPH